MWGEKKICPIKKINPRRDDKSKKEFQNEVTPNCHSRKHAKMMVLSTPTSEITASVETKNSTRNTQRCSDDDINSSKRRPPLHNVAKGVRGWRCFFGSVQTPETAGGSYEVIEAIWYLNLRREAYTEWNGTNIRGNWDRLWCDSPSRRPLPTKTAVRSPRILSLLHGQSQSGFPLLASERTVTFSRGKVHSNYRCFVLFLQINIFTLKKKKKTYVST